MHEGLKMTTPNTSSHEDEIADGTGDAGAPKRKFGGSPLVIASCGVAFLATLALVAVLRPAAPARRAEPEGTGTIAEAAPGPDAGSERLFPLEIPHAPAASRPASAARIAILVRADAAFDAGDFAAARDLYLDLLLAGQVLEGPEGHDHVVRWAHGRLALALAKLARAPGKTLIEEPALDFREKPR
jgi:hypothetical protein